jgi:hypothetical protein
MKFLVLCPRCRHRVSVQVGMAGQLSLCPYCKSLFKVPPPPPSHQPASTGFSLSPLSRSIEHPSCRTDSPALPRNIFDAAPVKTKEQPCENPPLPPDVPNISEDSPRTSPTRLLGLMSAGIVVVLIVLLGAVAFLSLGRKPSPALQGRGEGTRVAQEKAQSKTKAAPWIRAESRSPRTNPRTSLGNSTRRNGETLKEVQPERPRQSEPPAETPPSTRREEPRAQPFPQGGGAAQA